MATMHVFNIKRKTTTKSRNEKVGFRLRRKTETKCKNDLNWKKTRKKGKQPDAKGPMEEKEK